MRNLLNTAWVVLLMLSLSIIQVGAADTFYKGYAIRYHFKIKVGVSFQVSENPSVRIDLSNGGERYACCDDAPTSCACNFSLEDQWCKTGCERKPETGADIVVF